MSVILVVAAHPDDEILGVGATVARRVAQGDQVFALILGEGQTSRWEGQKAGDQAEVESLHQDSLAAAKIIGYQDIFFEKLPDNRFDRMALLDIVKIVERYLRKITPEILYTHHAQDLNIDHRITYEAVVTASRPVFGCSVKEIYAFETVSSTEWNFGNQSAAFYPNVFVDVSGFFYLKQKAMGSYQTELCEFPHPRSLEMLEYTARKWGGTVGKAYAEPFELVRKIE